MYLPPVEMTDTRDFVFQFGVECLGDGEKRCPWSFGLTENQNTADENMRVHRETTGHMRFAVYQVQRNTVRLNPMILRDVPRDRHR